MLICTRTEPMGLRQAMQLVQMIEDSMLVEKGTRGVGVGSYNRNQTARGQVTVKNTGTTTGQIVEHQTTEMKPTSVFNRGGMPGHRCASQTLQVLLVDERDEKSPIGDSNDESHEHPHLDTVEVSLNSVVGFTPNHTKKLVGEIGSYKVIMLIDSEATHNILSTKIVKRLGLHSSESESGGVGVILENGQVDKSHGMCQGVVITFPELQVIEDFYRWDLVQLMYYWE